MYIPKQLTTFELVRLCIAHDLTKKQIRENVAFYKQYEFEDIPYDATDGDIITMPHQFSFVKDNGWVIEF